MSVIALFECNSVTWGFYRPELLYLLKYALVCLQIIQKDVLSVLTVLLEQKMF